MTLRNRDYTLIIDQSRSMSLPCPTGNRTRWQEVQESTLALARKCEEFDPDGITVYVFSSRFHRYENVTSSKVEEIFRENVPSGSTNLAMVLTDAINSYFKRKSARKTKPEGEIILIITDGEPDDRFSVVDIIIQTTRRLERDQELGLSFIQVGDDANATKFLQSLDNQLKQMGAKFDICDSMTLDDMGDMPLTQVLMKAITD
jgi:uncharacterized protein YegL